jgi:hypothetical protein
MNGHDWIAAFATELGLPAPDDATIERLLALASSAAHQSERIAAPIACYLVGLGGVDPVRAAEIAAAMQPPD